MPKPKPLPSLDTLAADLALDPVTGALTHKVRPCSCFKTTNACRAWNGRFAGRPAGTIAKSGYVYVTVRRRRLLAHRIVLALTGRDPGDALSDHRDRQRAHNAPDNLRVANVSQNLFNGGARKDNKSGFRGVYLCRWTGRWRAEIRAFGKRIKIGRFDTPEAAAEAYLAAAAELHGEFAHASSPACSQRTALSAMTTPGAEA